MGLGFRAKKLSVKSEQRNGAKEKENSREKKEEYREVIEKSFLEKLSVLCLSLCLSSLDISFTNTRVVYFHKLVSERSIASVCEIYFTN